MWLVYLFILSLLATLLPLPISPIDPAFLSYATTKSFLLIPLVAGFDTLNAIITYYSVDKLKALISKVEFINQMLKQYTLSLFTFNDKVFSFGYRLLNGEFDVDAFINRWGSLSVILAAATPIPYTLVIYAVAGSLEIKRFTLFNFIGRLIKYAAYYYAVRLGLNIFG